MMTLDKVTAKVKASSQLITMKNGKLGWVGEFPEDKREFSALMTILCDDYIAHGGEVTYG